MKGYFFLAPVDTVLGMSALDPAVWGVKNWEKNEEQGRKES